MSAPLLKTKLYIPPLRSRERLVPRPRLLKRLNTGLGRKLTLISAPAGFGKTTLLSEWVNDLRFANDNFRLAVAKENQIGSRKSKIGNRIAWLSLDKGDNDPARFLAYLIGALSRVEGLEATPGEGALGMLHAAQPQPPPAEAIVTSLINEITAIPDRLVLFLDDYHLIEAQPIHDALTFLLSHQPPQLHLVIATREDPYLPLARLRAQGELTELRATDLRFTPSEAAEFLNQVMGLDLSTEDIAALDTRTEGWIAGLQLAALALQGTISMQGHTDAAGFIKSFTGSHHFVLDYLVEEVLQQQSEDVQTFLLQTAVLDRLSGPLCDAVRFGFSESPAGQKDGQATLESLEHANLFIVPLDEERRWYRYHHLFADLLRRRLRQMQPDWVFKLHRRASEWHEQNGFVDEAIEHALRAEDVERAAHLVEEHVEAVWRRGEHTKLRRWLAGLPVELVFSKPHLCILHAWDLFTSGQQDAAEQSLQAAEQTLGLNADRAPETSPPGSDRMQIQGRVAAIRAFLASYRGDIPGTIQYAHRALEYLPEQDLTWRSTATIALGDAYSFSGDTVAAYRVRMDAWEASRAAGSIYMILIASLKLAVTLRQQGHLQRIREICQGQMQLAEESGVSQTVVVGWLLAICSEVLAELDDLDEAIHQARNGVELAERGKDVMVIGWSNLCLLRVLFSRGDIAGAEEIIQKMEHIARKRHVPPWITNQMAAWQVRIWLAGDKLNAASQWVKERGLDADGDATYLHEVEYIALARILIAQGRLDQATRLLQRLLEATETEGRISRAIEILLLQALAYRTGGDTDRAMTTLECALTLAEPGGFVRIFVDEGPPMARLLYESATRGIAPDHVRDYARRLLAAFPVTEPTQTDPAKTQSKIPHRKSEIVEPLSERELEVLQLIAAGLTNQEIATRLFLALNTIKAHTRNIYGKLGVHSRTQAVARSQELGLLPPPGLQLTPE